MTQPNQLLPEGAFNFSSIANLAARTKGDWEAVWADAPIRGRVGTFIEFLTGFDDLLADSGLEPETGDLILGAFDGPLGGIVPGLISNLIELVGNIADFVGFG